MDTVMLSAFSDSLADVVAATEPSVVQVEGRGRPVSGVVYADNVVVTTARALGRDDHLRVRTGDDRTLDAQLAGWDPSTGLAVLRVDGLNQPAAAAAISRPRVGHLSLAIARSWSNAITASAGIVAVIGGPLRTGRNRAIEEIIRTTTPMHEGFAGGPLVGVDGRVLGISTAATIRGLAVVIPAAIAWKAAADVLQHGSPIRGYLGVAGQQVRLTQAQIEHARHEAAVLVVAIGPDSPASRAGMLVGDVLLELDGQPVRAPEDLLDLMTAERVGREVPLKLLRGGTVVEPRVTVGRK